MPSKVRLHPHIFNPNPATQHKFRTPRPGRGKTLSLQARDRADHARRLLSDYELISAEYENRVARQKAEGIDAGNGAYLQFESEPGFDLKFESLDVVRSGIELCSVRADSEKRVQATVFVPDGKLSYFLKRINDYRYKDTTPNQAGTTSPKNRELVESIAHIRLAALKSLWTDDLALYPNPDKELTWEVWLRKSQNNDLLQRFKDLATDINLVVSELAITFVDRVVILVRGKGRDLSRSADLLGSIAELRLAKSTADFFTEMNRVEQQEWVNDLVDRLQPPTDDNSLYVCLLDTGINNGHPLLNPLVDNYDLHAYKPAWGVDDRQGHGTQMSGLTAYGDLTEALASQGAWSVPHRLESVKIINSADPNSIDLYGAVCVESINRVELIPDRIRIFSMAITTPEGRDRGRPSSWSAAIDSLASGTDDQIRRLIFLAAGNTDSASRNDYPNSNLTDGVHDPGQAWNALTVGGYTEKELIDQARYPGWMPLASNGDLAPASCTSMPWKNTKWPIKPDIVMEAGNMAHHPVDGEPDYIDDALQLLSTSHNFKFSRLLVPVGDTSAATALATRFAALLWSKYPSLTPEAVRALLVHSARWTKPMLKRFTNGNGKVDYESVLRCFGYGTPDLRELLSSADNSLTLIAQESIHPFEKVNTNITYRNINLHALPWPKDVLESLQDASVELRVTLSYFVEPNPGDRGWSTKFGYQSHGLRFAVKRATETVHRFHERINKAARDDSYDKNHPAETGKWLLKHHQKLTTSGSIHSNVWKGSAADLAAKGYIAVFPTYGWWNTRPNLQGWNKTSHYSLVVTIKTTETDIYTPVANITNTPVIIET